MLRIFFSIFITLLTVQVLCATAYLSDSKTDMEAIDPLAKAQLRRYRSTRGWKRNIHAIRQTPPNPSPTPIMLDLAQWNKDTGAKCAEKLQALQANASNPSGTAICYNVPYADIKTGVFMVDLRLYQIAKPDVDWETVGDDIGIALEYQNATVTQSNLNDKSNNEITPGSAPDIVRVFCFLGMAKPGVLKPDMTSDEFKQILTPIVTLKGTKNDGTTVQTQLSTTEAAFVNGEFVSKEVIGGNSSSSGGNSSPSPTAAPVMSTKSSIQKIPGKSIAIMPIGMIIYSAWMVIGVSIFMYGTFERRKFRDHYRRRIVRSQSGGPRI